MWHFPFSFGSPKRPVSSLTSLSNDILNTFIPGYSLLSKFVLEALGIDVTSAVSVLALIFAFITALNYFRRHILEHLTASITINSRDDIHQHVLSWLSKRHVKKGRRLLAKSGWNKWRDDQHGLPIDFTGAVQRSGRMNFRNCVGKIPPQFEPVGSGLFWYSGSFFRFSRRMAVTNDRRNWGGRFEEDDLTITVLGRSTAPIKNLIAEAKEYCIAGEENLTAVWRPFPERQRRLYGIPWAEVAKRSSRPIETVALDPKRKSEILDDINEYLQPGSARWYSDRGVPYRRGYLLFGPPGTGKTSLSFAIAGEFGLDIYCISLRDHTLSEEDLSYLFNNLPPRCIVLLEDIDAAGLTREVKSGRKATDEEEKGSGISLSGLLNAIDGVTSPEGILLFMTTNYRKNIDEALIRPGRVDLNIKFTFATRTQAEQIFTRMYSANQDETLDTLASTFANSLPEHQLSPADIQGFLLGRKKNPKQAVDEVEEWRDIVLRDSRKIEDSDFSAFSPVLTPLC